MREIKYKVFDIVTLTMYNHVNQINFELECVLAQPNEDSTVDEEIEIDFERCVFMQYTGLKDKNGKEIYEGDVIKDSSLTYIVKFGNVALTELEYVGFYLEGIDPDHTGPLSEGDGNVIEVIGNIHETPELLL